MKYKLQKFLDFQFDLTEPSKIRLLNAILLIVHLFLMVFYISIRETELIYANIGSLVFYSFAFYLLHLRKFILHYYLMYMEIMIHVAVCVVCLGWDKGFQNWLLGLCCIAMLPFASSIKSQKRIIHSIFLTAAMFIEYVTLMALDHFHRILDVSTLTVRESWWVLLANTVVAFYSIILFTTHFILHLAREHQLLYKQADFDALTGLKNRNGLQRDIKEMSYTDDRKKRTYTIAMIDIDYFKKFNDTYGHYSGDMILRQLADIFRMYDTDDITIARWGGEEFLIAANDAISHTAMLATLEDLRSYIAKHHFHVVNNTPVHVTISIGVSHCKEQEDLKIALECADQRLYEAKNSGRNRMVC